MYDPVDDQGEGRDAHDRHGRAVLRRGEPTRRSRTRSPKCSRPRSPSRRSSSPARRSASTASHAASATSGIRVKALHGDMSQGQRDGVMIAFKGGRERLLVATDVAARGLDISGVSHVVNYDVPNSPGHLRAPHRPHRPRRARAAARSRSSRPSSARTSRRSSATRRPRSANGRRARHARRRLRFKPRKRGTPEVQTEAAVDAAASSLPEPPRGRPSRSRTTSRARRAARATPSRARNAPASARRSFIGAGRKQGLEPEDVIGAIVDNSHLDGEDISNVRVLERFTVRRGAGRARGRGRREGQRKRRPGRELRLEVAKR